MIALVVYQRQSLISPEALKLIQRILDRLSIQLKPFVEVSETTNKHLLRLASTQSNNMYS